VTLPGSSETLGTGGIIATQTVSSKKYQAVMIARPDGHLAGTKPDFMAWFPPQTNAAGREVAEVFNAHATNLVRIRGIWLVPTQTVITGVAIGFDINKISAVGTTGLTTVTPRPQDSGNAGTLTSITAGYGSTAGGTLSHLWFSAYLYNEETSPAVALIAYQNLLPTYGDTINEIVLRQNEGIQVKQQASGTVGLTGALIQFTLDS
jgi:hypothetical protein